MRTPDSGSEMRPDSIPERLAGPLQSLWRQEYFAANSIFRLWAQPDAHPEHSDPTIWRSPDSTRDQFLGQSSGGEKPTEWNIAGYCTDMAGEIEMTDEQRIMFILVVTPFPLVVFMSTFSTYYVQSMMVEKLLPSIFSHNS